MLSEIFPNPSFLHPSQVDETYTLAGTSLMLSSMLDEVVFLGECYPTIFQRGKPYITTFDNGRRVVYGIESTILSAFDFAKPLDEMPFPRLVLSIPEMSRLRKEGSQKL